MQMNPRFALAAPRRARVEIIPLIDVVFFLLATFVLFSFMMAHTRALPLTLPAVGESTKTDNVVLQLVAGGSAYWNQEPISLAELPARLTAYKKQTADPRVLISGDDQVKFGPVVAAIDEVRSAGIRNFSVETHTRPAGK
jgi:biopolymer transport protein ExbD